jgi:DNA modification methylase
MSLLLVNSNSLHVPLADKSVHCVITSPPYFGLRDYGTGTWEGGDPQCDHVKIKRVSLKSGLRNDGRKHKGLYDGEKVLSMEHGYRSVCGKCGAVRVDRQIGLEESVDQYVENILTVAREVWRVLRDDGTFWLNLGDSYNGSGGAGGDYAPGGLKEGQPKYPGRNVAGLKPKDLIGIPWRVAFALQEDGWYLRSDIIWSKTNSMPEPVTDRPSKAHEYVFLLSKSRKYYYDAVAIKETAVQYGKVQSPGSRSNGENPDRNDNDFAERNRGRVFTERNKRTVWTIATLPYTGAHFATFPPALVEPGIKAGTSEHGVCPICGAPWKRVIKYEAMFRPKLPVGSMDIKGVTRTTIGLKDRAKYGTKKPLFIDIWTPTCNHKAEPVPAVVLDIFVGSGTTLMVARQLGRSGIGLDLSYDYLHNQARRRLRLDALENWNAGEAKKADTDYSGLPLFGGDE